MRQTLAMCGLALFVLLLLLGMDFKSWARQKAEEKENERRENPIH